MSRDGALGVEMTPQAQSFLAAIARELPERPSPELEAAIVRRAAAAAIAAPIPRKTFSPRMRVPMRVALVAGALVAATTGLAFAGVELPGPVDSGLRKVGISLPNQDNPSDHASRKDEKDATSAAGEPGDTAAPGGSAKAGHRARARHGKRKGPRNHGAAAGTHPANGIANGQAHPEHPLTPSGSSSSGGSGGSGSSGHAHPDHPAPPAHPAHPPKPVKEQVETRQP
jgi:hypothetical protein